MSLVRNFWNHFYHCYYAPLENPSLPRISNIIKNIIICCSPLSAAKTFFRNSCLLLPSGALLTFVTNLLQPDFLLILLIPIPNSLPVLSVMEKTAPLAPTFLTELLHIPSFLLMKRVTLNLENIAVGECFHRRFSRPPKPSF